LTSASVLYSAAGSPPMSGTAAGCCRTCGDNGIGLPFDTWVKDTFTNFDCLFPGDIVCHACLFGFDEGSELLRQRVGKDKPQRMRNYSHFVADGAWQPVSKGNKRYMRDLLMQEPELAVIADSGQKHILFRARPGFWQFEEQKLTPCPHLLSTQLLPAIEILYNAGASKSEIETGHYAQKSLSKIGITIWRKQEQELRKHRGGLPFCLAIFLAQKDDDDTRTDSE